MCQGWISLHRQITDNWLWKDKPFSKGQAWIDLLLRVNHKENKTLIGNKIIEVKEGQTIWSMKDMATKWGWSRKKVKTFLEVCESEGMLSYKSTSKYTTVTIENWALYQNKEHQKNMKSTSNAHQKNTNNNDNNDNNDNKNTTKVENSVPYKKIKDLYNDICKSLPSVRSISSSRKTHLGARWKQFDFNIDTFEEVFNLVENTPFLTGSNNRGWKADFDWLIGNDGNMVKVLEGKYKQGGVDKQGKNSQYKYKEVDVYY